MATRIDPDDGAEAFPAGTHVQFNLDVTLAAAESLSGGAVVATFRRRGVEYASDVDCTIVDADSIQIPLTPTDTQNFPEGDVEAVVEITLSSGVKRAARFVSPWWRPT